MSSININFRFDHLNSLAIYQWTIRPGCDSIKHSYNQSINQSISHPLRCYQCVTVSVALQTYRSRLESNLLSVCVGGVRLFPGKSPTHSLTHSFIHSLCTQIWAIPYLGVITHARARTHTHTHTHTHTWALHGLESSTQPNPQLLNPHPTHAQISIRTQLVPILKTESEHETYKIPVIKIIYWKTSSTFLL